jgi:hypothetical protein
VHLEKEIGKDEILKALNGGASFSKLAYKFQTQLTMGDLAMKLDELLKEDKILKHTTKFNISPGVWETGVVFYPSPRD